MKTQLSRPMQAAMWITYFSETQPDSQSYEVPYHLRGLRGAGGADATAHALSRRGLFNLAARMLTDAGRAWIAEQIEAARIEALREHVRRAVLATNDIRAYPVAAEASYRAELDALRLAARWGVMTPLPSEIVRQDFTDACETRCHLAGHMHDAFTSRTWCYQAQAPAATR
jgi:hypothetical protein